ncbi:MAG: hypothetical protein KAW41_05350 [Candidatus Diapherotrites archaeon]|nr:hypothetical protein [Candidatus Diapherotrites archaeon]
MDVTKEELEYLVARGLGLGEIAWLFRVSSATVRNECERLGLAPPKGWKNKSSPKEIMGRVSPALKKRLSGKRRSWGVTAGPGKLLGK